MSADDVAAVRKTRNAWRVAGLPARGQVHHGLTLKALGAQVRQAVVQGGVCLLEVQLRHRDGSDAGAVPRLMTVTGVEVDAQPSRRVRALMLLDPSDDLPWGAGHNTRLPITGAPEHAVLRYTNGRLLRFRVRRLIEWRAAPSP
ncbi:hypothetical protein [Roseateles sp. BYS96W]|uniref:Uncharacterized protein n=1 Tax=Pelomonas nitida TaxID=3299027 RepID=A0ABW7G1T9_9BURK